MLAWFLREDYSPAARRGGWRWRTGCLAGFVNGALISRLRVVPFIVTLGTMTIYLGLAKIIGDNTTVRPMPTQVPDWMRELLSPRRAARVDGVSAGRLAAVGRWRSSVAAVLRYTVFGRHVFAIGSNESTARLCGINVPLTRIAVYTIAGFFVGMAGLYQFAGLTDGRPDLRHRHGAADHRRRRDRRRQPERRSGLDPGHA